MIIERNLAAFVVYSEDPLLRALEKISANKARIIFCVSEHGMLEGALTDGDFRRWIADRGAVDLDVRSLEVANQNPTSAHVTTPQEDLQALFQPQIDHLPLVDDRGRVVAVAINRSGELRIGPLTVGPGSRALLIAEIGINHNGSVPLAKRLVDEAAAAGADCVKFQLRDMASLYRRSGDQVSAQEDLGPQYTLDLLSRFSLDAEQLFEVFDHCAKSGIVALCTPWDLASVEALHRYGVPAMKIASADLTNHPLLTAAAATGIPLIMSTGMSTEAEIQESVRLLRGTGTAFALLHCNSTYPAPFKDVNLTYLDRLAEIGQCPVGYSGHERGFHVPLAAIARGAKIIEKHFTLDREMEGNDHKVSLLPEEFAEMVRRIRELEEALGSPEPRVVSTGEMMNRINLAKSLVAARRIELGEVIADDAVSVKSPGRGLQPNALPRLLGRRALRSFDSGDFFYATDLGDQASRGGKYKFGRPWGLPVRYHDFRPLLAESNPDFLEFHLSYKDLEVDLASVFDDKLDLSFAVHSPELFSGDHLMNLASDDVDVRTRSIADLQNVIDLTRSMRKWFPKADDPVIIANLGGFTKNAHVPPNHRAAMYERVAEDLARLDVDGVRLCPQTLPPFPWLFGGQLFHNLFMDAEDTADFARNTGWRLCLDISHTKLASTFTGRSFSEAIDMLAPYTDHLHIVDATGVDGEGVQIGEGEVDFAHLAQQLAKHAPAASFIPEIWQGHVNDGEGFWLALQRLEQWF